MSRLISKILILTFALLSSALSACAQDSLSMAKFFSPNPPLEGKVRLVYLSGDNLDGRDMTLFRSLLTEGSTSDVILIGDAVKADSRLATNIKTLQSGQCLKALYIQLSPSRGKTDNRFVLFRRLEDAKAMLVYIEGPTTLDKIVNVNIKNKNTDE